MVVLVFALMVAVNVSSFRFKGYHFLGTGTTTTPAKKNSSLPDTPVTWVEKRTIETEAGEEASFVKIPPSDHMATADELFAAVNDYRGKHNLSLLKTSSFLCGVAEKRAQEVLALGDVDHSGFSKYTESQQEFSLIGEILFTSPYSQSGVHIVEMGWDKSKTGHKEELQNPVYTHGCAGISGYYAVFIFGGEIF